ncbi:MAG: TRAP transporter small permease subunit [Rhodothalassiaceae bacterium]
MTAAFLRISDRLCRLGAGLAALALALVFVLGMAEIIARALFATSLGIALEFSGYLTAAALLLGAGEALRQENHIRITLLRDRLPPRGGRILDLAAAFAGLAVAGFLALAIARYALVSFLLDARSYFPTATPLWLPQALLALGAAILATALVARLLQLVTGAKGEDA